MCLKRPFCESVKINMFSYLNKAIAPMTWFICTVLQYTRIFICMAVGTQGIDEHIVREVTVNYSKITRGSILRGMEGFSIIVTV